MPDEQPNNPLHGVTLKAIVESLVERYGWEELAEKVPIRCFQNEPTVKSSLKFLRKTEWARKRVEALYLADLRKAARNRKRNQRRADRRSLKVAYDAIQEREAAEALEAADTEETDP